MRKSLTLWTLGIAVLSLGAGCKPSADNKTVQTSLFMTGSGSKNVVQSNSQKFLSFFVPSASALTPPLLLDASGLSVNLSDAWIVVQEVEFKTSQSATADEFLHQEIEFHGPFYIDLLSNAPNSFGTANIPIEGIRRIKMQLHAADSMPASAPAGLNGNSIYFSGSVNGVAFTFSSTDSTEFEIGGSNPVVPNSSSDLLTVIRTANLFEKINLSSLVTATNISASNRVPAVNPCPLIDAMAADLYTCFRKGLSSEANFGNDNGKKDLDANDETVRK